MSDGRANPSEKVNLSLAEESFITFLQDNLPDDWKIYFKPHLNGSYPDLIIMNPHVGIMIYSILDEVNCTPEAEIRRLEYYKKKIIRQLVPSMGEMIDKESRAYGIIRTGVYVHGLSRSEVEDKFKAGGSYLTCAGQDSLHKSGLKSLIPGLSYRKSKYMKPEWASQLEFWMVPPYHREKRTDIQLTEEQKRHAKPQPGHRRLRGAAGSGKTLVIAHRAARLAADGHRVLIVTFNSTLWQYIREMVDRTPYNFDWSLLTFRHFHGFCYDIIHELKIPFDQERVVEDLIGSIRDHDISEYMFDAVLIDEGQDFEWEWYNILSQFLTERDELFFVCDERQNIYDRELSWVDKMSDGGKVKFRGKWRELGTVHRLSPKIAEFANKFAQNFLKSEDNELDVSQKTLFDNRDAVWRNVDPQDWQEELYDAYSSLTEMGVRDSEIAVLVPTNDMGIRVAKFFSSMNVKTDHLFRENGASNKRAFISDGRMKVSTIHGFKGWEARSVIILIPDRWGQEENLDAVIYTAITRTLENLIILNTNERYLEFYENDDDVEIPDISEDEMDPELEEWIETLPYPLASIIWESMTVTSYESRVRYLIHFFEALAEFNFNLIISGLSSNELFFDMRAREAFQGVKNNLERPTFGYWTTLLFKAIRSLRMALKDRYHKNQVHKSFGKPGDDFLNALASANLPLILKNVLRYRNIWEGHGPRVSEEEYRKRYSVLIGELRKVRDVIGNTYSNAFLVIPSEGILDGGVHRYTAKRYMTTRAPFRAVKLESEEPMDSNSIYLANPNKRRHLELLPLIINNDDTCYFYNGIDDETGKARYCSYHNKDKAEIFVNPPPKLVNLQEMLNQTDSYN